MRPFPALIACLLITLAMGSIHAFGVLLAPIEAEARVERASASLIYSVGLVSVTAAVFVGHRLYAVLSPPVAALSAGLLAGGGLLLASSGTWATLILGYGGLFGFASGLGYGFALHAVSRAYPTRKGAGMGAVTACYAVGAILFSFGFHEWLGADGLAAALRGAAVGVTSIMVLAGLLLWASRLETRGSPRARIGRRDAATIDTRELLGLWVAYGAGVFAGLMVIGHAVGITLAAGGGQSLSAISIAVMSAANAVCGIAAGWISDRAPLRTVLATIPLVSALLLLGLVFSDGGPAALVFLTLVGGAYGALIAVYPVAVAVRFGADRAARAYGRVFTAWGVAGLAAPVTAGWLYELSGGYRWPLLAAAALAVISAATAARLRTAPLSVPQTGPQTGPATPPPKPERP